MNYLITVKCGKQAWAVHRRFSEFAGVFGGEAGFPKKTLFPVFSEAFLTTRQEQLNTFLSQYLERVCNASSDFSGRQKVLEFFGFPHQEHVAAPTISSNSPGCSERQVVKASETTDEVSGSQDAHSTQNEIAEGIHGLSNKYEEMLKEVAEMRSTRDELLAKLSSEEASHALRRKTVEDLQTRLDEEIVSYSHAKAFIEDLQIRLEEVLTARAVDWEATNDLQQRLEEVAGANQSQDDQEILARRVNDLQARIDEETVSYEHAKTFIEDLQNRIDEVITSIESLQQQQLELHSEIESVSRSNAELKSHLEGVSETTNFTDSQSTSETTHAAAAEEISAAQAVNASPVSKESDQRPSSVASPTNVEGIHNDSEPLATKPTDEKSPSDGEVSKKSTTRRSSKKRRS